MKKTLTLLIALIVINTENSKIKVTETIIITAETGQIVNFWIQTGAKEYAINSGEIELTKKEQKPTEGNVYSYIISSPNIVPLLL